MNDSYANRLIVPVLLLGLLGLGWWIGTQQGAQPTPEHANEAKPVATVVVAGSATMRSIDALKSSKPLQLMRPDEYAELGRAATHDPEAAYRLAQGLEACFRLRVARWDLKSILNVTPSGNPGFNKSIKRQRAEMQALVEEQRKHCIGNVDVTQDEVNDALARAAQMGSHEAQYQYSINPRLNILAVNELDRMRDWHDIAPTYLNSAVQRGEARAVLTMAAASDQLDCHAQNLNSENDPCNQSSVIGMILPQNAAIAYRYYLLYQLLGDNANAAWVASQIARLAPLLNASEIADAQAQAQQLYAQIRSATQ